ncbi:GNAT family N-acetyltransferase [Paenibacillus sp. HN-1]|uniref:GNAT family N-acetyltransferase n=1 Tax=Paenibacillus TaxID=44249 RepID=UPI001CAA2951|nr:MULTISPECIES: GNAT family N-acetyltransferase [Paenibacillus]MBY9078743.1 GNAT family N-acetyltransferase [Paenibacillus sp. CGMCC 1.18879]MBY9088097.1 GNAT family N-acetyltransferase [Paenibacillus sinensis]
MGSRIKIFENYLIHMHNYTIKLFNMYATQGQLLHCTRQSIYEQLQCFYVAVDDENRITGVASLHILDRDLAEIRSLVVLPGMELKGIRRLLVEALVKEANMQIIV